MSTATVTSTANGTTPATAPATIDMCMCMCNKRCMARTKRIQVLVEPDEFNALEQLAQKRGTSVSDLMREAARTQWLAQVEFGRRAEAVRRFLHLPEAVMPEWEDLKAEIEDRRG